MTHRFLAHVVVGGVLAVVVGAGGCPIGDPLPGIGANCELAKGSCDVEHVCIPAGPGGAGGVCAPVLTFGLCDAKTPVTHPPGRAGKDKDSTEIEINGPEDLGLLDDVRSVTGQVRVFKDGVRVGLDDVCGFRALQAVGDGLAIGDTSKIVALDGLQSMTSVQNGLAVVDNLKLTDLHGLDNLVALTPRTFDSHAVDIVIATNPQLKDADVDAFLADLEARVGRPLSTIACNNRGRLCSPVDAIVVNAIVHNSIRP